MAKAPIDDLEVQGLNLADDGEDELTSDNSDTDFSEVNDNASNKQRLYDNDGQGYLLILNSKNNREGNNADIAKLQMFFGDKLRFKVNNPRNEKEKDLSRDEFLHELTKAQKELGKRYYCFICVIMSHGSENGIATADEYIKKNEIREMFNNKHISNFIGRPKIFLIQSCRGGNKQKVCTDHAGPSKTSKKESLRQDNGTRAPKDADTLVASSTTSGHVSYRHPSKGSWFIEECINVFTEHHREMHFEDMLTIVKYNVATRITDGDQTQMPCSWSTLRKCLMLK